MITERTSHCSYALMTDLLHNSSSLLHTAMCACGLAIFASNVYKQGVTSSSRGKGRSAVRDQGSPSDGKQMALQQATNRTKVFRDCKSRPPSHGREHAPLRSRLASTWCENWTSSEASTSQEANHCYLFVSFRHCFHACRQRNTIAENERVTHHSPSSLASQLRRSPEFRKLLWPHAPKQ